MRSPAPVVRLVDVAPSLQMLAPPSGSKSDPRSQILKIPGNGACADCGALVTALNQDWACVNLGIVVCLECSGAHRSLGTHISVVRSLSLDTLKDKEVNAMLSMGNMVQNTIFERAFAHPGSAVAAGKPNPNSEMKTRIAFVKKKWADHTFCQWKKNSNSTNSTKVAFAGVVRVQIRSASVRLSNININTDRASLRVRVRAELGDQVRRYFCRKCISYSRSPFVNSTLAEHDHNCRTIPTPTCKFQ